MNSAQPCWSTKRSAQDMETYEAARLLFEAPGFSYRPADEQGASPVEESVQRLTAIIR